MAAWRGDSGLGDISFSASNNEGTGKSGNFNIITDIENKSFVTNFSEFQKCDYDDAKVSGSDSFTFLCDNVKDDLKENFSGLSL